MATSQSSQALVKRKAEQHLMPPPPPPKRIKRPATVIEEDLYMETLSHIIKRDFFPGLVEIEAQQEFLDAVESKDSEWISEAGTRLNVLMTPGPAGRRIRGRSAGMTPIAGSVGETPKGWNGSTPMSVAATPRTENKEDQKPKVDHNISLSAFQAKYTSEDSESFNQLLDKHNQKKREKNAWLYNGNKLPSKQQLALQARAEKLLEDSKDAKKGMELAIRSPEDDRPAMANVKTMHPMNPFMFHPESIEDTHITIAQERANDSIAPPKEIVHDNTRMPVPRPVDFSPSVMPSPSLSAIDAALAGKPKPTESEPGFSGGETPRYAGYKLVNPESSAAEMEAAARGPGPDPNEIMKLLPAADSTPNPFKIAQESRRDELGRKMVEKIAAKKRIDARRIEEMRTPMVTGATVGATPRFLNAKTPMAMTPAAKSLLERMKTPRVKMGRFDHFGK
jgi:protein DGCR14